MHRRRRKKKKRVCTVVYLRRKGGIAESVNYASSTSSIRSLILASFHPPWIASSLHRPPAASSSPPAHASQRLPPRNPVTPLPSSMMPWLIIIFFFFFLMIPTGRVHSLGVNWGTQASHPLSPQIVVKMLKANAITKVKLFDTNSTVIRALANTNIEVMVSIPNNLLASLTDAYTATQWVQNNVARYIPAGTKIRYVAVGNEPYLNSYNGTYIPYTYPALKNIQQALNNANIGDDVKATVPLNADVLSSSSRPSETVFRSDVASDMMRIVELLADNDCPFTINIYPFLSLYADKNFPVDYAFFGTTTSVVDGEYTYYNVFDASYDSLVAALTKIGYGNMSIIVGEIGWPTDGDVNANMGYALKFNQGIVNHLLNNGGTPRRPNQSINTYLFSLLDEDMKSLAPGNFERHWGIFTYDGQPKYALSLSGSSGKSLVAASGVKYLKHKWCVLNATADMTPTLAQSVSYACANSDCTSLGYGCSCNNVLDANGNASYAFNQYFQRQDQESGACSFGGLGHIVSTDPSIDGCSFMIQLASSTTTSSATSTTSSSFRQVPGSLFRLLLLFIFL